jgi:hypothetical protein
VSEPLGIILALASAGFFAAGYVGQHRAVAVLEPLSVARPLVAGRALLSNRGWLLAIGSNTAGWGIYIAAIALAPLSIVQAVCAGSVGALALVSRRSRTTSGKESVYAIVACAGLVLVLVSSGTATNSTHAEAGTVALWVSIALVGGFLALALSPRSMRGAAFGALSGCCYGAGDVATKAVFSGSPLFVPVVIVCAIGGFVALHLAYQRSSLLASAGVSSLFTNATPIVAGVVIFGETATSSVSTSMRAVGFAAVLIGAVGLATEQRGSGGYKEGVVTPTNG